jgi:nucleolar pre-ribosomal-associated protein 2
MTASLSQPQSQEYVSDAVTYIRKQSSGFGSKGKKGSWNFASTTLCEVVLAALLAKEAALDKLDLISCQDLKVIADSRKDSLLVQMKGLLKKSKKSANSGNQTAKHLDLLSVINALTTVGVDGLKLAELTDDAKSFIALLAETEGEVVSRLETFMSVHARDDDGNLLDTELNGDASTVSGRQGIVDKVNALIIGKDEDEKLELLKSLFGEDIDGLSHLDRLLAARHIISTCKGLSALIMATARANNSQTPDDPLSKMKEMTPLIYQPYTLCFVANYVKPPVFDNFFSLEKQWR